VGTRNAYKIVFRKPEDKKALGRSRHRWEDGIEMYHNKLRV
jgi:hypothetical protein